MNILVDAFKICLGTEMDNRDVDKALRELYNTLDMAIKAFDAVVLYLEKERRKKMPEFLTKLPNNDE